MALRPSRTFDARARFATPIASPVDSGITTALNRTGAAFFALSRSAAQDIERAQALRGQRTGQLIQAAVQPLESGAVPLARVEEDVPSAFGQAFNTASLAAFGAQVDLSLRRNAERIAVEHRNDPNAMQNAMQAFTEGFIRDMPPELQPFMVRDAEVRMAPHLTAARERAIARDIRDRIAAIDTMQYTILAGAEQYGRGIHGGSETQAANLDAMTVDFQTVMDAVAGAVNAGALTPAEGRKTLVQFQSKLAEQYIRGSIQGSANPEAIEQAILDGNYTLPFPVLQPDGQAALEDVNLTQLMVAEDEFGALQQVSRERSRRVSAMAQFEQSLRIQDRLLKRQQEQNERDLRIGIYEGQIGQAPQVTEDLLVESLRSNVIDSSQFDRLITDLRNEDEGVDDPLVVLQNEMGIAEHELSPEQIYYQHLGGALSKATAIRQMQAIIQRQEEGGPLASQIARNRRQDLIAIVSGQIPGTLAVTDPDAAVRTANALRQYDALLLEGVHPDEALDRTAPAFRLRPPGPEVLPQPRFRVGPPAAPDLQKTKQETRRALDRGELTIEEAAEEMRRIEEIERAIQEREDALRRAGGN